MDILILIALFVYLTAFLVFFTVQFFNLVFRGFAPFFSTREKIIRSIIDKLKIGEKDYVVELGCGKAGFLKAVRKLYPKLKLVGYEYSFLPYMIARLQTGLSNTNIDIRKANFFKVDLSRADVIYCYLNTSTMKKLEEKFRSECKVGAKIVSFMFPLKNMQPKEVQEVGKGEKVYYYTIE